MSGSILPLGWAGTTFGNVLISVIGGGTPSRKVPTYFDGQIPWFTVKDMKVLKPQDAEEHISETAVAHSSTNLIPANTLIVATRIALGRAIRPTIACAINQDLKALVLGTGINSDFFLYWIGASERIIQDLGSGTTVSGIRLETLHGLPLLLPPAAEQTRIVAKLEELLSDLEAGVAELKAAQKKLAQYRQSLLKAAVDGVLNGNALHPVFPLSELITEIGQGWSPKCENESAKDESCWGVIKTTAIQPLAFDGSHNKALPSHLAPRPHLELSAGDLLVTRAGPRSRVGITCLIRSTRPRLLLCDKAYRIKCDQSRIDPRFLELVLNAPNFVQQIDRLKTGINDSGLNLTQDRFGTLLIPVPELAEQQRAIMQFQALESVIQQQDRVIEMALKQAAAQRQNILRAAFSGQLVPQDPNDEPARVLLERIRAERAERDALKKPRGRRVKESA